jgi:hypothetical protein
MSNTTSSGHAVNLGHFQELISHCESYGTRYNPSNPAITLVALKAKQTASSTAMDFLGKEEIALNNLTNSRSAVFNPIKPFCTQLLNGFKSCGASAMAIANLTTINRKIQGTRADETKVNAIKAAKATKTTSTDTQSDAAATDTSATIKSVSQQGFDDTVEFFGKMVTAVKAEPLYKPNEDDLTVVALEARHADLKAKNNAYKTGEASYDLALTARDNAMYADQTGLVDLTKYVKSYVKSVYTATSPEFLKINKLRFRKL